jgi:paraquat-inducible protein A
VGGDVRAAPAIDGDTATVEEPAVLGCESCGLVSLDVAPQGVPDGIVMSCPRCHHPLRHEKPHSVQRTWACVLAAAVLYIPANAMPVMSTVSGFEAEEHTLLGGIHELWVGGSWVLAIIVFIASIAVPVLKIAALGLLAWSVRKAPRWRRLERARLYRLIELVGHWSMLDVYVVVLLGASVRFGSFATAHPEPGLLAFTAVVVLTLLATHSFDARLIWRDPAPRHG